MCGGVSEEKRERTVYSVQKAIDRHIELDDVTKLANHSCDPNTGIRDNDSGSYTWYALKPIHTGDEITWDYETTEYLVMSNALQQCLCGSKWCRGSVVGYKQRSVLLREKYGVYVADYLKEMEGEGEVEV
eukprot:GDKI01029498.1.p2 GENE.GDKI01029498.1~~GDKI01029498.1.p2  ORF type:complete len:130 (-),score=38.62 GDKI01029498.1:60-449(-)